MLNLENNTSFSDIYEFLTYSGEIFFNAHPELIAEIAELYSKHYGDWDSSNTPLHGKVKLSAKKISDQYIKKATCLIICREKSSGNLVGYAIAVKGAEAGKSISWVTQLVVHTEHRNRNIGKMLLYSMWGESQRDAWGIVTSNPYAVRALEKATHRRCELAAIRHNKDWIYSFGIKNISYISAASELQVNELQSAINTKFFISHQDLSEQLNHVTSLELPWKLGTLAPGWEWFAFTVKSQKVFPLSPSEIQIMLDTSDQVTKQAYSKMDISHHPWAQFACDEIRFILTRVNLDSGAQILDLGCGNGRHSKELARMGYSVTAVDYICYADDIKADDKIRFIQRDILDLKKSSLSKDYDLVLCLYDVIGSYADDQKNSKIIKEIYDHLAPGGSAVLSVMNLDYLLARKPQVCDLNANYEKLLSLSPQNAMQKSGDIFDNDKIIIDRSTSVCYRIEQFSDENDVVKEFVVRDRRYTVTSISEKLRQVGFQIREVRYVRAGKWDVECDKSDGKEILVFCMKPLSQEQPEFNFED